MPNLTFVLPHWLYWFGLVLVPLGAMLILRLARGKDQTGKISLPIAYFLLVTAGFIGMHRFYLRNKWGIIFIPLFVAILFFNQAGRESRNEVSRTNNEMISAEFLLERANKSLARGEPGVHEKIEKLQNVLQQARVQLEYAHHEFDKWNSWSRNTALLILALLIIDVFLLPGMLRRCRARADKEYTIDKTVDISCAVDVDLDVDGKHTVDYAAGVHTPFVDFTNRLNEFTGQFVAYWSMIAVMVYFYEVIARYVFNSPTNWAHESMFLMFGMQYLLAGGYVLRHNGHVRVDVIYTRFSTRNKAIIDIFTSVFFFIFAGTLLWTGWTFFYDSFASSEVSFSEWTIQYWPIKLSIPLGAALILLQGMAWLAKDIAVVMQKQER